MIINRNLLKIQIQDEPISKKKLKIIEENC